MSAFRSSRPASTPMPWLSVAMLVAALFFSIHARLETEAVRAQTHEALNGAEAYFLAHPYLEPGPLLRARFEPSAIGHARTEYEERRVRNRWMETPPSLLQHQQAELESRIDAALVDVPEIPARQVAVVAGEGFSASWLTHALLHVSHWQLFGNGLLLLLLGVYLERSLGRPAFAGLATLVTLAGAGAWQWTAPADATYGLVGAAPLLAGLLAAFAVRFAEHWDEGFYLTALIPGSLWLALPPWAQIGGSFAPVALVAGSVPPAAASVYAALLGAAVVGAAASGVATLFGVDGGLEGEGSSSVTRSPQYRRAMRARAAGRPREAMELLMIFLAADPDAYEAAVALHDVAKEAGRDVDASDAMLRVVRIELKRELVDSAIDHWLELTGDGIPEKADPLLLIHMALLLREEGRRDEAVHALKCALERSEDRENHVFAAQIARAARGLDPGVLETAAWRALGFIELGLGERQALESLIAESLEANRGRASAAYATQPVIPPKAPAVGAPPEREPARVPEREPSRVSALDVDLRSARTLDAVVAVPLELADEGIEIQTLDGKKKLVRYERVEAAAVSAVHGLATKPVLVLDLVLNWKAPASETLRVIRLRGDRYDPRRFFPGHASAVDALRSIVKIVLERSGAAPLPDAESAEGRPFASFDAVDTYHRQVLLAEEPKSD